MTLTPAHRTFIGREGKYQIPKGAIVEVIKFWPRRKALVRYEGKEYITMTTLLRKIL